MNTTMMYVNFALQIFQRSNPLLEVLTRLTAAIQFVVNYKSMVRLNRYRHGLYMQQLNRMEGFLAQGSPYQYRGNKINRTF